jgi:hypothetical protein
VGGPRLRVDRQQPRTASRRQTVVRAVTLCRLLIGRPACFKSRALTAGASNGQLDLYHAFLTHKAEAMRFVRTSGTGIREIVEQRPDAGSAYQHVLRLISFKRPAIRVFDADGHRVSLEKLRRLADGEGSKARQRP